MTTVSDINWTQASETPVSASTALLVPTITPINRRTVNLDVFARETGTGLRQVYELARRDALPVPVIRIGRRMVISRQALDDLLASPLRPNSATNAA